jgi:hypothetical protein
LLQGLFGGKCGNDSRKAGRIYYGHFLKPSSPHVFDVHRHYRSRGADPQPVWNDIFSESGQATYATKVTETDKLLDRRPATNIGEITNSNMATQQYMVSHDDTISNLAVVTNVGACHQQAVVSNKREPSTTQCASVNGDILSYSARVSYGQSSRFSTEFEVLRLVSN